MSSLKQLKALNNQIIFTFAQDTSGNIFHEKTKFGITIVEHKEKQLQTPRWAKVVKVGKDVSDEITEGMYILIESLGWTTHNVYQSEKFWVTNEDKVLATSEELPSSY